MKAKFDEQFHMWPRCTTNTCKLKWYSNDTGEGRIDPHPWRGDGVWTRSRIKKGWMVIGYVIRRAEKDSYLW